MAGRRGNNEGSWWQGNGGRWYADITVGPGKRVRRSAKTQRELKAKIREVRHQAEYGQLVIGRSPTLAQYLDTWLQNVVAPSLEEHTHACYADRMRHVTALIGHLRLTALTPDDIRGCYRQLERRELSKSTIRGTHVVLKRALTDAVNDRMLSWNPASVVHPPKVERAPVHALTPLEVQRLIGHTRKDRLGPLWHVLVTTGLRFGEATGLRWSDVNLDARKLVVQQASKRKPGGGFRLGEPKTTSALRTIELSDDVCTVLREHRVRQIAERLAAAVWTDLDLVFPNTKGEPLNPGGAGRVLHRACTDLGIQQVSPHGLRHTAATLYLYDLGEPLAMVQEILGHASFTETAGRYGHLRETMQRRAVDRLDTLLRTPPAKESW